MVDALSDNVLVTCCIPCYNHEKYVKESIRSVIKQGYSNIELIVIDDGSKDNSVEVIKALEYECKKRFVSSTFIYRENKGLSFTLNEMLKLAKGDYITFLASDDKFFSYKVEYLVNQLKLVDNTLYCAIFGDAEIFSDLDIHQKGSFIRKYNNGVFPIDDVSYASILNKNYLPAMSALYVRKALLEIGGFTDELRLEDWDIYLRLLQRYQIKVLPKKVAYYRLHNENSIFVENIKLLKDTLTVLFCQRDYSLSSGYKKIWYWKLYDTYYSLLRKRALSPKNLKFFSFSMALSYIFKKITKNSSLHK